MGKLLQINPVIRTSTSTGKIMRDLAEAAAAAGWQNYVAYAGGRDGLNLPFPGEKIPVGGKLNIAIHALETRLFDRHGLSSRLATRAFVRRIKEIKPDVIHIHNVHGYFLNYKILFKYLASAGIPVVWTVHDCWLYTGHCYHYASAGCDRWQTGCHDCPLKRSFPQSLLFDRSRRNYLDKKAAFNSLGNITFVTVSEWMRGEMSRSFLKGRRIDVIHNGINLEVFKPTAPTAAMKEYSLEGKTVILAVCSIWLPEKGIADLAKLAGMLDCSETLVVVGAMTDAQAAALPASVVRIARTADAARLAQLYSAAVALVNPTWQDNYPTVNMEAIACGTPVVTYRTGGSPESIEDGLTGYVVEQGDVPAMLEKIRLIEATGKEAYAENCRRSAVQRFGRESRYEDYIKLYESITVR